MRWLAATLLASGATQAGADRPSITFVVIDDLVSFVFAAAQPKHALPSPSPTNIELMNCRWLWPRCHSPQGFDDTALHGSTQIPTPTLTALANEGVLLMNYYVMPVCTPTRSAIHTGRHPIHTGMQGGALLGQQKLGLPLGIVTLPEQLKELGYGCYAAGKWHLVRTQAPPPHPHRN